MRMGDKEEPTQISEWAEEQKACQHLHTLIKYCAKFFYKYTAE